MSRKRGNTFLSVLTITIISFMFLCAGFFLFDVKEDIAKGTEEVTSSTDKDEVLIVQPVSSSKPHFDDITFKHISKEINGMNQEINILEIDLKDGRAKIMPVLSHGKIFGFEMLSDIALRNNAYAAVNAGFFYEYGEPSGMVVINGEIITNSTGKYPVFIINDREASLEELDTEMWIEFDKKRMNIDNINTWGKPGEVILYTPSYGTKSRVKYRNISVSIVNDTVIEIAEYNGSVTIPENGMVLAFLEPCAYQLKDLPFKIGNTVKFVHKPDWDYNFQAYECGNWVVKEGEIIIGKNDEWIGVTTNRDPRTVIGLKDKHTVLLMTVDGRQPGYSEGFTGYELGRFLLDYGINNAAMLDGGASTEMILNGEMVNKPSFKGQERPLAGGLIVKYQNGESQERTD